MSEDTRGRDEATERTLQAYREAKWETLRNEGPAPLRRELARLLAFLERADDPNVQRMNIDARFRRRKAKILQEILAKAKSDEGND